jgi:hypothetical protein
MLLSRLLPELARNTPNVCLRDETPPMRRMPAGRDGAEGDVIKKSCGHRFEQPLLLASKQNAPG